MRINRHQLKQSGSTLLLTLVATMIIGSMLVAYLTLVKGQHMAGMRSQAWNATIPVIEAGMEEALTHLNNNGYSNLLCDGWTLIDGKYVMERHNVGDGFYNVSIANWVVGATNQTPIIESRGFVTPPTLVASANHYMFAAQVNPPAGFLGRGVRGVAKQDFMFTKALVAKGKIDLKGNNVRSDSFDSSDPTYSTGGSYDVNKSKASGDIATNDTITNSVNVGNADVYGHVATGPNGTVDIGPTGSVGDTNFHNPQVANSVKGIQPGAVTDDMNMDFPDARVPSNTVWYPYLLGATNGYDYHLESGNYRVDTINWNNQSMVIMGNATLYVTGDLSLGGTASIIIAPGAKLTVYIGGSGDLQGNGVINTNNAAGNLLVEGLSTCTSLTMGGNFTFVGCIYAPNANLAMNGAGGGGQDFVGSAVVSTVSINGHVNFHYDEALKKYGPHRGYILTSWNEMRPDDVRSYSTP